MLKISLEFGVVVTEKSRAIVLQILSQNFCTTVTFASLMAFSNCSSNFLFSFSFRKRNTITSTVHSSSFERSFKIKFSLKRIHTNSLQQSSVIATNEFILLHADWDPKWNPKFRNFISLCNIAALCTGFTRRSLHTWGCKCNWLLHSYAT